MDDVRILLIEDDQDVASFIQAGLEQSGYTVDHSSDGKDGLYLATTEPYDALIVDRMLPGVDGLTIVRTLRASGRMTPALILSALGEVDDRVKGLKAGGDDYLVKPFAFEELLARVKALTRRHYDRADPVVHVDDLAVDTSKRTVSRAGRAIDLTAREYALLEFLALRAGEVVSRSDIWEHLYSFDDAAESNVVDVYIGYLRKKLEHPDASRIIHTRRGQGYMLGGAS